MALALIQKGMHAEALGELQYDIVQPPTFRAFWLSFGNDSGLTDCRQSCACGSRCILK